MRRLGLAFTFLMFAGCGEPRLVGSFEGFQHAPGEGTEFHSAGIIRLDLNRDGSCTFMRMSMTYEGTFQQNREHVDVQLDRALDRPMTSPLKIRFFRTDKGTLQFRDEYSVGVLTLTKATSSSPSS